MNITLDKARELTGKHLHVPNNRYHSHASEVVMRALALRLGGDPEQWAIAGHTKLFHVFCQSLLIEKHSM
jgi:predicted hydrolase (HD superfamily)